MNGLLWILQILLAIHTAIGAVWKLSNPAQNMPSLTAIPPGAWLSLSGLEILCSLGLILPLFSKRLAGLPPLAAACIAGEMLLFSGLHLASGDPNNGPMIYWLVVAALCAFIAYGRSGRKPV